MLSIGGYIQPEDCSGERVRLGLFCLHDGSHFLSSSQDFTNRGRLVFDAMEGRHVGQVVFRVGIDAQGGEDRGKQGLFVLRTLDRFKAVDVGRSERVVPGATRRALNVRDKGCRWPGCDRTASWTAAHHVIHWTHGGLTDLNNLVLLCAHHHWSVHDGGWDLAWAGDRTLLTVPPRANARAPDYRLTG